MENGASGKKQTLTKFCINLPLDLPRKLSKNWRLKKALSLLRELTKHPHCWFCWLPKPLWASQGRRKKEGGLRMVEAYFLKRAVCKVQLWWPAIWIGPRRGSMLPRKVCVSAPHKNVKQHFTKWGARMPLGIERTWERTDGSIQVFFWSHCTARGILLLWPGIEPVPLAVEVQSLNHCTTRGRPKTDGSVKRLTHK